MQPLTCPVPSNINPLQSNGFMFSVIKLPEIEFFCQEASLPGINAPAAQFENRFVVSPLPGDKLEFNDLTITFLINENMDNYVALLNWMTGLGFPESNLQYANFINERISPFTRNETSAAYSDAILQILNSSNNPVCTIHFIDVLPVSVSSLQFQSTSQETTYLAGQATFQYTYYKIE